MDGSYPASAPLSFYLEEEPKKRVAPRVTGASPAAEEFPKGLELF